MTSGFVRENGEVVCPICHVTRHNMALMVKHLYFWHDLTPPNVTKVMDVVNGNVVTEVIVRRDGEVQRLWVEVPLPGF